MLLIIWHGGGIVLITLQYEQGSDVETIIDTEARSYYQCEIGYLISEFMDLDLSLINITNIGSNINHPFWKCNEIADEGVSGACTAGIVQGRFRLFFDYCFQNEVKMDIALFKKFMGVCKMEVPTYSFLNDYSQSDKDKVMGKSVEELIERYLREKLVPTATFEQYFCIKSKDSKSLIEQLCVASVFHILSNQHIFKKCENCGKLFVPSKQDAKYCDRISPQYASRTCKEAVIYKNRIAREKQSEAGRIYKSIYTMKYVRGDFEDIRRFMGDAQNWRDDIKRGSKTEGEYIDWLKTHYVRKKV